MKKRRFGKSKVLVSEIGLGTWQLGTQWGTPFNPVEAEHILETAQDAGINLIDTADIYQDGESEKAIGRFLKQTNEPFFVITKCGRGLNPHTAEGYTPEAVEKFIDGSLARLGTERLDMILLHCPPESVYHKDEIFTALDKLQVAGKVAHYGVSIETVAEGLQAVEYPIAALEVIYNMFRLKPEDTLFGAARRKEVGIIARVPLASGLLSGCYDENTVFGENDHRYYNRHGEAFDKGETFSGVDYDTGLKAVNALKELFHTDDLVPYALRWILMNPAVTTVIPGASKAEQVRSNVRAAEMAPLTDAQMDGVRHIYDTYLRAEVHPQW